MPPEPEASRLCAVFNQSFAQRWGVAMGGGGSEPLYQPARDRKPARIVHTRDYPASALHEAAHWCIAGPVRRQLTDYGYQYLPPPRSPAQSERFMAREVGAQALELIFSRAAGVAFKVSIDDLDAPAEMVREFDARVRSAATQLDHRRLAGRPAQFRDALLACFATPGRSFG